MYERFTDRSRKVMQLANQEAQRFNHEYIGTEHILLGLVKEGSGIAAELLNRLQVDLRKIRLEIEKIVQSGSDMVTMGKLPITPRAKKVYEYAIEESKNLDHNYVGTEHILLGLIREEHGVAAQVLLNLGVNLKNTREKILSYFDKQKVTLENAPKWRLAENKYEPSPELKKKLEQNISYVLDAIVVTQVELLHSVALAITKQILEEQIESTAVASILGKSGISPVVISPQETKEEQNDVGKNPDSELSET